MTETLYKHPDYVESYERWKIAKDLADGKRDVITSPDYLWYHSIEQKDKNYNISLSLSDLQSNTMPKAKANSGSALLRAGREQRTRYPGLQEVFVSLWQSLFFRSPARADEKLKNLLDPHNGWRNIDGKKTSVNAFLRNKVLPDILKYGKAIILADSFPIQARNLAEQKELGLRPFLSLINPLNNTDWSYKTDSPKDIGSFNFFRHEFLGVLPRISDSEEPKLRKFSHTLKLEGVIYTVTERYVDLDDKGIVVKEHWDPKLNTEVWQQGQKIPTTLNRIPVSVIQSESWLDDVNQEILRHYNIRSNRDNINYNNGYDIRYAKLENASDADAIQALSEYTVVILSEKGDFGKLPASDPTALEKAEKESIEYMFKIGLNKLRQIAGESKETQSAEAIDKDNEFTHALVESELEDMEDSINESFKNYALFMGVDDFDGKIELDKRVSSEDFSKFITTWMAFKDSLLKVDGVEKAGLKKVIKKLRLDSADEKEILSQIEGMTFKTVDPEDNQEDVIGGALNG